MRKPQYAAYLRYEGSSLTLFGSWGANTLTTSNVSRTGPGNYSVSLPIAVRALTGCVATVNTGGNWSVTANFQTATNLVLFASIYPDASADCQLTFMTVP